MLRVVFYFQKRTWKLDIAHVCVLSSRATMGISTLWHIRCLCSIQSHSLIITLKDTCYKKTERYSSQPYTFVNATEASSARLPVVDHICTSSAHAQTRTRMYTDKHIKYAFADTAAEDKNSHSSFVLKRSTSKSLQIARRIYHG